MPNFIPIPQFPYHPHTGIPLDKTPQPRMMDPYQERGAWDFLGLES